MAPPSDDVLRSEALHRPAQVPILTVQQHILREQQAIPGASGEFSWLMSGITLATKMIAARVRHAGLTDALGTAGQTNVQGEEQQKLDVYANETLLHCLSWRESIGFVASEENERPIAVHHGLPSAKYAVVFDPLDGSSNLDVNVSVGTTFSVLRRPEDGREDVANWVLQPGRVQVAAGYVLYGSSTMLVYSIGRGVHGFTLDPSAGAYVLSHENIRMPGQGRYYSVNEAYHDEFPAPYREFLTQVRQGKLGRRVLDALCRLDGRRLPSHAAQGRHLPVSADRRKPLGQAAAPVRSEPDRVPRRAGRRRRDRRPAAHPRHSAGDHPPAHRPRRRQFRGDGRVCPGLPARLRFTPACRGMGNHARATASGA